MGTLISILGGLYQYVTSRWFNVAFMCGAIMTLYYNFLGIMTAAHQMVVAFEALLIPTTTGSSVNANIFNLINYVLPLDAAVAMFYLYVPFLVSCIVIRVIKSFVPFVSG